VASEVTLSERGEEAANIIRTISVAAENSTIRAVTEFPWRLVANAMDPVFGDWRFLMCMIRVPLRSF
jgi:hypothetical protein